MTRIAILAPCALAVLALAGCQSEEEKRAEREKLKSELRQEILSELQSQVPGIVAMEFQRAVDEHRRNVAAQAAAAKAKPATGPAKPAPKR
jgi:hypothetical protein